MIPHPHLPAASFLGRTPRQDTLLDEITPLADRWHRLFERADAYRRFPARELALIEDELDALWAQRRHRLAVATVRRFHDATDGRQPIGTTRWWDPSTYHPTRLA